MNASGEASLSHHGVKGMKWGVRKAPEQTASRKAPKHTESRKDYKKRVKSEERAHYDKKLDRAVKAAASKGDDVLIKTRTPGDNAVTVATGREFLDYLSKGGVFDIKATDVFATLDKKTKEYVVNEPTSEYKKSARK